MISLRKSNVKGLSDLSDNLYISCDSMAVKDPFSGGNVGQRHRKLIALNQRLEPDGHEAPHWNYQLTYL